MSLVAAVLFRTSGIRCLGSTANGGTVFDLIDYDYCWLKRCRVTYGYTIGAPRSEKRRLFVATSTRFAFKSAN